MIIATVTEGEAGLARLIDAAVAGEEAFISRDGKSIVRLTAIETEAQPVVKRKPGIFAGQGFGFLQTLTKRIQTSYRCLKV